MTETESGKMPTAFIGHGSPMNALQQNQYTSNWSKLGRTFPRPSALLCISAHWITSGTSIQASPHPKQIFDIYGFPKELYQLKYEPIGSPKTLLDVASLNPNIQNSMDWGLDHGAWSVLYWMYPLADVPTLQLSLNRNFSIEDHIHMAQSLKGLRERNILVLASGNIVHNLQAISWKDDAKAQTWAIDYELLVLETVGSTNYSHREKLDRIFSSPLLKLAHPTPEHLIPLIYTIGMTDEGTSLRTEVSGIQNSSISMASVIG